MRVLTINSGSSSIKSKLFDNQNETLSILIEKIGKENAQITIDYMGTIEQKQLSIVSHSSGFEVMQEVIKSYGIDLIERVGHRVVHGGDIFVEPTLLDDIVIAQIEAISHLAPLHNPSNLLGITIARSTYPKAQHFAIFDTAFHQSMPAHAYRYAIKTSYYENDKIRRYGFHGSSHSYIAKEFARLSDLNNPNLITIHLGNGASICAIKEGKSIDTSMGFTPLEGLVMGSRSGDLDPSIALFIAQKYDLSFNQIDNVLNKQSGLKGICDYNDMRDVIAASISGNRDASLAIDIFCYRIKKYIGAYLAVIGQIDGVIFTGGIGEHSPLIRERVMQDMGHLNLSIDKNKNNQNQQWIEESGIKIAIIPTNEELEMARLVLAL
ncbi:MAG: acetate kinase [Campylobacterota bacterium]|nr:acetate kinase [Campylobacterota bacterium]